MNPTTRALLATTALLAAASAQAYTALARATAEATTSTNTGLGNVVVADMPPPVHVAASSPTTVTAANAAHAEQLSFTMNAVGDAVGYAQAGPGWVRASAAASGSSGYQPPGSFWGEDASGAAFAIAQYSELLVWNVAGLAPNTRITIDFAVRVDGVASASPNVVGLGQTDGHASYDWHVYFDDNVTPIGGHFLGGGGASVGGGSTDFGLKRFSVDVMTGVPVTFEMGLSAQAHGRGWLPASGHSFAVVGALAVLADLSHTFTWGGVSAVRQTYGSGAPLDLARVSVSSESGTDYLRAVTPVPEPPAALLLLAGAVLLSLRLGTRAAA